MYVKLIDAKIGQILLEDVLSPKGQMVARTGTILNAQILLRMAHYRIDGINVEIPKSEFSAEEDEDFMKDVLSTKIRSSKEFKEFQAKYIAAIESFGVKINEFITRKTKMEDLKLLEETKELYEKNITGIGTINYLLNMREVDDSTYAHSMNVALISRIIGEWSGITGSELDILTLCGLLHDIGKARIPKEVLLKPGKLTDDEYEIMKQHTVYGYELLKDENIDPRIKLAALQHHEKYDGSGYPMHVKSDIIEPFSQIVTIADVYDAMTADRCYRAGICPFEVIADFLRGRFSLYNPDFLMVFLNRIVMSYVGAGVLLSNGHKGKVLMINSNDLTRPLVQLENGGFCDLYYDPSLYIKAVV